MYTLESNHVPTPFYWPFRVYSFFFFFHFKCIHGIFLKLVESFKITEKFKGKKLCVHAGTHMGTLFLHSICSNLKLLYLTAFL